MSIHGGYPWVRGETTGGRGEPMAAMGDGAPVDPTMANLERRSESRRGEVLEELQMERGHRPEGYVAVIVEAPNGGHRWRSLGDAGVESGSTTGTRRTGTGDGKKEGEGVGGLVGDDVDEELRLGIERSLVHESLKPELVQRIGGTADELLKEDLPIWTGQDRRCRRPPWVASKRRSCFWVIGSNEEGIKNRTLGFSQADKPMEDLKKKVIRSSSPLAMRTRITEARERREERRRARGWERMEERSTRREEERKGRHGGGRRGRSLRLGGDDGEGGSIEVGGRG